MWVATVLYSSDSHLVVRAALMGGGVAGGGRGVRDVISRTPTVQST